VSYRWFVPADVMIGKKFGSSMVASLQLEVPIVDDLPSYNVKLEARIGFFF
jgi:hypothetical protein